MPNSVSVDLGRVPKNRGTYVSGTHYYKDNIVQYQGSSFIASPTSVNDYHDGNDGTAQAPEWYLTRTPFETNPLQPRNGWEVFASGRHNFSTGEDISELGISSDVSIEDTNKLPTSGAVASAINDAIANSTIRFDEEQSLTPEQQEQALANVGLSGVPDIEAVEQDEWMQVVADSDNKFLFGIKGDGSIEWSKGVPTPVKNAIKDTNEIKHEDSNEYLFAICSEDNKRILSINGKGGVDIPNLSNIKPLELKVANIEEVLDNSSTIEQTSFVDEKNAAANYKSGVIFPSADVTPASSNAVIEVANQEDFNDLRANIQNAISNAGGSAINIVVKFASGTYYYDDEHVALHPSSGNDPYTNVSLSFVGNGATLIGKGKKFSIDDNGVELLTDFWKVRYDDDNYAGPYFTLYGMTDKEGNIVDIINQNPFEYASSGVENATLDNEALQRIKVTGLKDVAHADIGNTLVMVTMSWEAFVAEVYAIATVDNNQYIYFSKDQYKPYPADNRNKESDYGTNPRYKLINDSKKGNIFVQNEVVNNNNVYYLYVPYNYNELYESRASIFLMIDRVSPKNITVSGFNFVSNGIASLSDPQPNARGVITLNGAREENNSDFYPINESIVWDDLNKEYNITPASGRYVSVCNNSFKGLKSCAVYAYCTGNIYVANNSFDYNYAKLVYTSSWCSNVIVENNKSNKQGLGFRQDEAIDAKGNNFLIRNNEIVNSVYSAINTGDWWEAQTNYSVPARPFGYNSGVIEKNVIYNTSDFNKEPSQNALMDGAPIYVRTLNNETYIRYNIIYDIEPYRMRYVGIYVDGGGHGYKIYQNIVLGGFERSLYQQWWGAENNMDASLVAKINRNNMWLYNIVDKPIYVYGCKDESSDNYSSIKGENFILYSSEKPSSSYDYLQTENDAYIRKIDTNGSVIFVPSTAQYDAKAKLDDILTNYIKNHIYKGY